MAEVRGMAFLGLFRFVKSRYGSDKLEELLLDVSDTTRLMCSERIRQLGWYPYSGLTGFLRRLDRVLGTGDLSFCREFGAEAGRADIEANFSHLAGVHPESLIRACTAVWATYYRGAGRMEAISWDPANTVLRIFDFPDMDPTHCRLMEGWMIATMAAIGATVRADAHERLCMSKGDPYHDFWCTWTLERPE
jgi:hypothetical protein